MTSMLTFIKLFISLISLILLSGCSDFQVGNDIRNKTIRYDKTHNIFYIIEKGQKQPLKILYKQKECAIYSVIQNDDKTLTAMKVDCIPFLTKIRINNKTVKVPRRYVILISDNKVIYSIESLTQISMRWINRDHLLIIFPFRRIIVNKKGKVVMDKSFKQNQLISIPKRDIY